MPISTGVADEVIPENPAAPGAVFYDGGDGWRTTSRDEAMTETAARPPTGSELCAAGRLAERGRRDAQVESVPRPPAPGFRQAGRVEERESETGGDGAWTLS